MIDEPSEGPRKAGGERRLGPPLLVTGPPGSPTVMVCDPGGEGRLGELPAAWRPLTGQIHVVWLRLPAVPTMLPDVSSLLDELPRTDERVHVLAGGPAADLTLQLAAARPADVRSVLLIDPVSGPVEHDVDAQDVLEWRQRTESIRTTLTEHGVLIRILHVAPDRARQHGSTPLGHPDVVDQLCDALLLAPPGSSPP